jgi:hypothetical protein
MRKKNYVDALLDGYKPAVWVGTYERLYERVVDKPFPKEFYGKNMVVLFQNDTLRRQFVEQMEHARGNKIQETYIMGITLGFPERSVAYFCECERTELETEDNPYQIGHIGMEWAGFSFSTHVDIALEEARELWATYTHEKAINEPMYLWTKETSYIEVPYNDYTSLEIACAHIREKQGIVTVV